MVPEEELRKGASPNEVGQRQHIFATEAVGDHPREQRAGHTAHGHESKGASSSFERKPTVGSEGNEVNGKQAHRHATDEVAAVELPERRTTQRCRPALGLERTLYAALQPSRRRTTFRCGTTSRDNQG